MFYKAAPKTLLQERLDAERIMPDGLHDQLPAEEMLDIEPAEVLLAGRPSPWLSAFEVDLMAAWAEP
jgi:hypothetical protein